MRKTATNTIEITPAQYATLRGYKNNGYVNKLLLAGRGKEMPNVLDIKVFGRFRTIVVPADKDGKPVVPRLTDSELAICNSRSEARKLAYAS